MGISLTLTGLSASGRERLLALALPVEIDPALEEDGLEALEALGLELEEEHAPWWPDRGDGKSWEVIHWALTGVPLAQMAPDTVLFGCRSVDGYLLAEAAAVLTPAEVTALADELAAVTDAEIGERLGRVPPDAYWAALADTSEGRAGVRADARELVAYVRGCADAGLGMLMTLN